MGRSAEQGGGRWSRWLPPRDYLRSSASTYHSLLLIAPVFVLYQAGVLYQLAAMEGGTLFINGADYMTRTLLGLCSGSLWVYTAIISVMPLVFIIWVVRTGRRAPINMRIALPMLVESGVYALSFSVIIHVIQSAPKLLSVPPYLTLSRPSSAWDMVFQSLGAGFNEEILFRLVLLGGLVLLGRALSLPRVAVLVSAFLLSSLAFSAFHYIGPYADAFAFDSFMYCFLAGIMLATIYWWRGLAVVVYTHAFYDLYFFFVLSLF